MKDRHYEASDYSLIKERVDYGFSLLKAHDKKAFVYITHNLHDLLDQYNPDFAIKIYNIFKQFQINLKDDDDESVYEKALKKYQILFDEYFRNMVVDIQEHHGFK